MEEFEILAGILGIKPKRKPKFLRGEDPMYRVKDNTIYYKDFESLIEECLHCLIHEMLEEIFKKDKEDSLDYYLEFLENIEKRIAYKRVVNSLITCWYLEDILGIEIKIRTEKLIEYLEKNKERALEDVYFQEYLGIYIKRRFHWEPLEMKNPEKVIEKLEKISKEDNLVSFFFEIIS